MTLITNSEFIFSPTPLISLWTLNQPILSYSPAGLSFEDTYYLALLHLGASLDQSLQKKFKVIQKQVASNFRVCRRMLHTTIHWLNTTLSGKGQVRGSPWGRGQMGKRWIVYTLLTMVHWLITKNRVDSWGIDAEKKDEQMNKWIAEELTKRKKQKGETLFISL